MGRGGLVLPHRSFFTTGIVQEKFSTQDGRVSTGLFLPVNYIDTNVKVAPYYACFAFRVLRFVVFRRTGIQDIQQYETVFSRPLISPILPLRSQNTAKQFSQKEILRKPIPIVHEIKRKHENEKHETCIPTFTCKRSAVVLCHKHRWFLGLRFGPREKKNCWAFWKIICDYNTRILFSRHITVVTYRFHW